MSCNSGSCISLKIIKVAAAHSGEESRLECSSSWGGRKAFVNIPFVFSKRKQPSSSGWKAEPHTCSDSSIPKICSQLETFKLGNIFRFVDRLQPIANPDFDEYQEQFPPKTFPTPEQTWYNVPNKDDGSHSWPLVETWPPPLIIDLRKHVPLFMAMFVAVVLPICLVQRYAYPATQKVGNRPGYDCM